MAPITIISELVRAALDTCKAKVPDSLTHEEWELILGICAAQKIHTFVFDALPESGVPEDIIEIWSSHVRLNERAGELVESIVARLPS